MSTDTALFEKREELKRRLAAGEYKTLVDVFLEWFDRLIRKIIRRSKPIPAWSITAILVLVTLLTSFASSIAAGTWTAFRRYIGSQGLEEVLGIFGFVLPGVLAIASPVAINQYIGRLVALWHSDMLEATESTVSLDEFENWLEKVCNWRAQLLVTIMGGIAGGLYLTVIVSTQLGVFLGYGWIFINIIVGMFSTAFFLLLLGVVFLSGILRRYDLRLFAADPGNSELISRLSSELSFVVYFFAVYAAVITLVFTWLGFIPSFVIILVTGLWLPIIVLFIVNQTSLSSIIRRAKWKTLNKIQKKVANLQTSKDFGNQETMDAIKRLMDYHDRVKATRDTALDFRTYLSFINSLLLPLLAFILGNLDLVVNLFARKP